MMKVLIFLLINMSPSIKWSYLAPDGGMVTCSPAIADIDTASPGSEIIFATSVTGSHIYCLSSNGDSLWSFNMGNQAYSSPIIANLGVPGDPAIIIMNLTAKVYCLDNDGTLRWSFNAGTFSSSSSSPIVANIDTTGPPEIIVSDDSYIYCLNNDGTERWGVSLPNMHLGNSPAVANINKLGTPEILISTEDSLYCLNNDGTIRWASQISTNYLGICSATSPSIGDVDLDGDPEVVFGDWCFEADGTLKWHYGLSVHSTSAIADVDNDGFPEVVTYCETKDSLYVFRDNGTSVPTVVWTALSIDLTNTTGETPIICDIDGDGDKDVLWQGNKSLRIYDGATGSVLYEDIRFTTGTCNEHGVAVADVDGDGKIELVAIYMEKGVALVEDTSWVDCDKNRFSGLLYHITGINPDLSVPKSEPFSWELHNTWLTQICEDPHGVRESEKLGMQSVKLEIFPNPFIHSTTIKYCLPAKTKVSLKIYDVTGRIAKTLVNEEKESGYHEVNLHTKDLASGIYFAKIVVGDYKSTKKLILVR